MLNPPYPMCPKLEAGLDLTKIFNPTPNHIYACPKPDTCNAVIFVCCCLAYLFIYIYFIKKKN